MFSTNVSPYYCKNILSIKFCETGISRKRVAYYFKNTTKRSILTAEEICPKIHRLFTIHMKGQFNSNLMVAIE